MEYILIAIVSFLIGWNFSENHTRRSLKKYVKQKMDSSLDDITVERVHIRVEKQGTKFSAYRVDDNVCLGRSDSAKELVRLIKVSFGHRAVTVQVVEGLEYIREYT